ncbi:MAG: DUF1440 domain-containing protein [Acidobacteriota bacterium]|nr:DUF1440 domain-containing protein [Acidobacteriota bacterium]
MRFFATVLFCGLFVGVLDGLAATALASFGGVPPLRAWQFVASGAMGSRAFEQGRRSAAIGLLLHFFIAILVTLAFASAARFFPWIVASPWVTGAIFGVLVYLAMRGIMGLSATPKRKQKPSQVLAQLLIHIVVIGIPTAWLTKHFLV